MYHAEIQKVIDAPWTTMEPIRVGPVPTGVGTPGVFVTVERGGKPFARIDAWPASAGPFTQVVAWGNSVILGWSDKVHFIDPSTRKVITIGCDGYFGHLYPVGERLLIADSSRLICLDPRGKPLWKSEALGIDGVVVDEVGEGVIVGQGEWDPPGGWRPFRVSLANGEVVLA